MLFRVITSSKSSGIAEGLTYESSKSLQIGQHVQVPLRNKIVDGIVLAEAKQTKEVQKVKEIKAVLDEKPFLSEAQIKTLLWMADYYYCSVRQALRVWLPSPPWSSLLPKQITVYSLVRSDVVARGKKQQEIIEALVHRDEVSESELRSETGVGLATLRSLVKNGIITSKTIVEESDAMVTPKIQQPKLTAIQQAAYEAMKADPRPTLLFGITGSGKTEVYAQLMVDCIKKGQQALLLVPEILLTEHSIARFEQLLGREHIAVLHSRLSQTERRDLWRRIRRGESPLVIGSRSALFAPLHKLGLIVIDEEHEWTYKNEQTPRYHARETAEALARFANAKLVLGTATPSLEAWARAKSGEYQLAELKERYNHQTLPTVQVVDLAGVKFGSMYPFSPPLLEAIGERLKRKEQSVLFLNRRGVATALLCLDCRRRVVSTESMLPFTVHNKPDGTPYLMDHTTGSTSPVPQECPACHSTRLFAVGAGTQKVELILKRQFPEARLIRADSDTMDSPEAMRDLLERMREGRADILLGTQSVVKGLDLPNVTLAAVLLADVGLSLPHFRAGERVFQLLTQLTGRSGRAKPGEVIIQTFRPEAPEVKLAALHATEEFLNKELSLRVHSKYPPASRMVRILVRGTSAGHKAKTMANQLQIGAAKVNNDAVVTAAPTFFSGQTTWHILLRGTNPIDLLSQIDTSDVVIDRDPLECI